MSDKPKPPQKYQFCDAHMRPSIGPNRCQECFGAQPTPVNDAPVQKVNAISSDTKLPETGGFVQQNIAEPALTDPLAQKVVESAQNYARAVEAVSVLTQQVTDAKECFEALQKKLKESIALREAAQDELRNATTKKVSPA